APAAPAMGALRIGCAIPNKSQRRVCSIGHSSPAHRVSDMAREGTVPPHPYSASDECATRGRGLVIAERTASPTGYPRRMTLFLRVTRAASRFRPYSFIASHLTYDAG